MRIIECPVCGRRYRFDDSKMTKERVSVRCRKCENTFVILKDILLSAGTATSASPQPMKEASPPPPEDAVPLTLVIKKVPGEIARLRIATNLMPVTQEKLSLLSKRLSKTPATFHLDMTPSEADSLLRSIESTGSEAALSHRDASRRREKRGAEDSSKGGWKKWVAAAILTLVLMTGGGLSYYLYREVQRTQRLEQGGIDLVIPEAAFFYVRFKDIEKNRQRIQENSIHTGFGSLFEGLKSTALVQNLLSMTRDWERSMGVPFFRPDLMDFIGRDMRVALYAGNGSGTPQFVLTLKANLKIKIMETLGRWLPLWQGRPSPRRMGRGRMVYAIQPEGLAREVYFFSEGMVYVASSSPDLIQTSTSLAEGQLSARDSLKSVSVLAKKGEGTGINQIGLFYVGLRNLIGSWFSKKRSPNEASFAKYMGGYGDIVGTISYGKGLVVESMMTLHHERLDQFLRALLECPPGPNKTLAYVPRNTIVYASNNSLDLATYLSWFRKDLKERRDSSMVLDGVLSEIRAKTGVDMEKEILPFLGREFAYAVMGANKEGGLELPAIQLFFEVKNQSKVEASIQRLLKNPGVGSWFKEAGVDLRSTRYEGVPITSLRYQGNDMRVLLLSALTPCYAFVDGFLVIGSGLESLKQMVDLFKGRGLSMLEDKRFTETKRLFRGKNNGMAYVDLKAVSRLVRQFITQDPLAGAGFAKSGGKRAQDLQAFLQILETLNYMWSETEFGGDRVRFLVYVSL